MAWRLAKSLETLRVQVNANWPSRDKSNDGTIGDTSHAARSSDHNPNSAGVVTAMDITNDPAHGLVARKLAETLVASRDPRIKYIISNAQIVSSKQSKWVWRPYSGSNAHRAHVHISVMGTPTLWDDTRPWMISGGATPTPTPAPTPIPDAPEGAKFYSMVPGGYFSSPDQFGKVNASIWSNNAGAVNGADKSGNKVAWVQGFQGFVKTVVIGGGNPIAVFRAPEQGIALWWTLLLRYRTPSIWNPPVSTVQGIVNRYGGGQDYSAYVKYVCERTGFAPSKVIDLNDDAALLPFAKAMFRYEAGVETPLSDAQLRYGFAMGRNKGQPPASILVQETAKKPSLTKDVTVTTGVAAASGGVAAFFGAHPLLIVGIVAFIACAAMIYILLRKD